MLARNPLLFGEPGETGSMVGVYHDHNLTSTTVRMDELRDSLVAVSREFVDVYNHTGAWQGVRAPAPPRSPPCRAVSCPPLSPAPRRGCIMPLCCRCAVAGAAVTRLTPALTPAAPMFVSLPRS
jgi:hypothetical protein